MRLRDVLLALFIVVIWGVNFVVIDIGLRTFPPFLLVALRYAAAALPAIFLVPRPRTKVRYVVGVGLFIGCGQFGLLFLGMHLGMPAGLTSLVVQCQAIFTALFSLLLIRERPTRYQVVGLVVASAGIAVIGVSQGLRTELLPLLLVVGAGASWALGNITARRASTDGLALVVWSSLVPPVPLACLSLVVDGPAAVRDAFLSVSWTAVAAILYLALLATLVGFGTWSSLLRRYPATAVAPFSLLVPVVGIATAWLVLGERITWLDVGGGVLVLTGLAVLNRLFARRSPADGPVAPLAAGDPQAPATSDSSCHRRTPRFDNGFH